MKKCNKLRDVTAILSSGELCSHIISKGVHVEFVDDIK